MAKKNQEILAQYTCTVASNLHNRGTNTCLNFLSTTLNASHELIQFHKQQKSAKKQFHFCVHSHLHFKFKNIYVNFFLFVSLLLKTNIQN